ncbi:MAG: hypothetical protein C0463_09410 [Idiomarina sp.]|nr:hypothetical protein [Idiomarina sp.]
MFLSTSRSIRLSSLAVLAVTLLSGCASIVSQGALSPPMLNVTLMSEPELNAIGYRHGKFCEVANYHELGFEALQQRYDTQGLCMAYMHAPAYDNAGLRNWAVQADTWGEHAPIRTRAMEVELKYWPWHSALSAPFFDALSIDDSQEQLLYAIELNTTRGDDEVVLHLTREDSAESPVQKQGTYVLMHGFRTNKQSLFFVAEALRFHGYDVVLVDLLGHGQSQGEFSFSGKPDAMVVSELMDSLALQGPVHALGMSMGGTTAAHLTALRDDIESLTLLAPMLEFVDAFVDAGRAYTRTAHLLPQSTLQKGAQHALNEVGTPLGDTSVVQRVSELGVPVLIFASANDSISSLNKLQQLQSDAVTVHASEPRTHHGMMLLDTADIAVWLQWRGQ